MAVSSHWAAKVMRDCYCPKAVFLVGFAKIDAQRAAFRMMSLLCCQRGWAALADKGKERCHEQYAK